MQDTKPAIELKQLRKIDTDRQVCRIRFSPCGKLLFGGGYDSIIRRWDMMSDDSPQLESMAGHRGWVQCVTFSPDNETLLSVDSWGRLIAWPYQDKTPRPKWQVYTAHDGWIRDLAVSYDAKLIATAGRDRFVRIWSAVDGRPVAEFPQHEHDLCRVTMHPDGRSLISGDLHGTLRHFDIASKKCVRESKFEKMHLYDRIQDVPGIYHLGFDTGADTLICAGGQPTRTGNHQGIPILHLVDWKDLKTRKSIELGTNTHGFVFDLAWNSRGFFAMVTSGNPGSGQFLAVLPDEGKPFFTDAKMANCHSLAMNPDGSTIVVAATNRNSQGNGAVRDKDGKYLGNSSPLHVFSVGLKSAAKPAVKPS